MGHLRRSSKDRQAELIDAALHIIATRGIVELSTRSLAEHVGMTGGAIFRHFATLDDLLEAVVAHVENTLDATFPANITSPLERLQGFVSARSALVGEKVGILRLVVSEQFLLALPENGSRRLMACVEKTRAFVTQCLEEAQETGEIRGDLAAAGLSLIVMGTIQMIALAATQSRSGTTLQPIGETLIRLLRPPAPDQ